jgi:hypothetical protein
MTVQLTGYFPALIIGEASVAAGYGLQRLAEPYFEKYPNYRQMGRTIVNLTGAAVAACLIGAFASVPLHVAITVGLIAQGVFRAFYVLNKSNDNLMTKKDLMNFLTNLNDDLVTKKDLMNFLTNLHKIPSLRDQFISMISKSETYALKNSGSDSDSDSESELIPE